jgi:hypothetical protein
MQEQAATLPHFTISDLFPNALAMKRVARRHSGLVTPVLAPIDATDVPNTLSQSACTIISAFHHFSPSIAQQILKNCVERNCGIFIVEPFTRSIARASAPMPALAASIYLNPFRTKQHRLQKGFFTYAIPLIPALGAWDAAVSLCRMYTEAELFEMVSPFKGEFSWRYEQVPYFPFGTAAVFYGIPRRCQH